MGGTMMLLPQMEASDRAFHNLGMKPTPENVAAEATRKTAVSFIIKRIQVRAALCFRCDQQTQQSYLEIPNSPDPAHLLRFGDRPRIARFCTFRPKIIYEIGTRNVGIPERALECCKWLYSDCSVSVSQLYVLLN